MFRKLTFLSAGILSLGLMSANLQAAGNDGPTHGPDDPVLNGGEPPHANNNSRSMYEETWTDPNTGQTRVIEVDDSKGTTPAATPAVSSATNNALTNRIPPGYTMVASAGVGKSLFITRADVKDAQKALASAVADLDAFFGVKINLSGAYVDAQTNKSGGAFFAAKYFGSDIHGAIFCGIDEKGATITVVYDRAGASKDQWRQLVASVSSAASAKQVTFPDQTGNIELPEGWQLLSQSCVGGVRIAGPAGQTVSIGVGLTVVTPNSRAVLLYQQAVAQARQCGYPSIPFDATIAPYTAPKDAIQNLFPELSRVSQLHHGPAIRLDRLIDAADAKAVIPGAAAGLVYYAWTKTQNNVPTAYRTSMRMETYSIDAETWCAILTELSAPDSSFDQDLPVMMQIANSFKSNDAAVAAVTTNVLQQINSRFASFEQSMSQLDNAFARQCQAWQTRELITSRCNANFCETIRGYRAIEDTATGNRSFAELGYVHDVVNKLNESQPGRYKEVPLRDILYPLPVNANTQ